MPLCCLKPKMNAICMPLFANRWDFRGKYLKRGNISVVDNSWLNVGCSIIYIDNILNKLLFLSLITLQYCLVTAWQNLHNYVTFL